MLNWLVIGIGDITTRRVIPGIQAESRSQLYAIVTRDPAKAAQFDVRVWTTLDQALGDPKVHAVYVATPVFLHAPQTMLSQYVPSLKQYRAIQLDVGLQDPLFKDNQEMDRLLTEFSIPHTYETYEGNHVDHIPQRFEQNVLPFFSEHLEFGRAK